MDISTLVYIPEILAWLVGIVLAVLMVRRGGSKAEKLLLAGCSLMFIFGIASPLVRELVRSLMSEQDIGYTRIAQTMAWITIPMSILMLAGLVCLICAFWVRFRGKRQEPA